MFSCVFHIYVWVTTYFSLALEIFMVASCLHQENIFAVINGEAIADYQWSSLMLEVQ